MKYETIIIYKPNTSEEDINRIEDKLSGIIKIDILEDLGIKQLAYKFKGQTRGRYSVAKWHGRKDKVKEIENFIKKHEEIIKFISVESEEQ